MGLRTNHSARTLGALWLAASSLAGCATNPVSGERELELPGEQQEIAIGREMDTQIRREMGLYESDSLQGYVARVGQTIARTSDRPDLPWQFAVVDVPVVNAFALPGGYVYLTRGLMAFLQDEAELAGVLGHEIGHIAARHAAQAYTRSTGARIGLTLGSIFFPEVRPYTQVAATGLGLLFLEYGRDDELQADRLGARYAAEAGWNPAGVADMLRTLARLDQIAEPDGLPGWLQTHSEPGERGDEIATLVKQLAQPEGQLTVARAAYLDRVEGLIYGPDPDEGLVRGREFLHPAERFAITYPPAWQIANGRSQVVAKAPDGPAYLVLQPVFLGAGNFDHAAVQWMGRAGYRQVFGSRTRINGLPAHIGTYTGFMEGIGDVGVRALHVLHHERTYLVAGIARISRFDHHETEFNVTLRSFRPLSPEQADRIEAMHIDVRTVRSADSWSSLAGAAGDGAISPQELAILNGYDPAMPPRPGAQIKVIRHASALDAATRLHGRD